MVSVNFSELQLLYIMVFKLLRSIVIPPVRQKESKPAPRKKVKKKSPRESPRESGGVAADPTQKSQQRVSQRLCESKIICFLTLETRVSLFLGGGSGGTPETLSETPPETAFRLFDPRLVLSPLPDRQDRKRSGIAARLHYIIVLELIT